MDSIAAVLPPFNGRIIGVVYVLYLLTVTLTEVFMEQAGAGEAGG